MTRDQLKEWDALTLQMVMDPQPQDYFTDHLCPVALVVERRGDAIKILKPDAKREAWDEGRWMSTGDFLKWVSYGSIPGYWVEGHRKGKMPWDKPMDEMVGG